MEMLELDSFLKEVDELAQGLPAVSGCDGLSAVVQGLSARTMPRIEDKLEGQGCRVAAATASGSASLPFFGR